MGARWPPTYNICCMSDFSHFFLIRWANALAALPFRPLCFGVSDPLFRPLVKLDNLPEADPVLSRKLVYHKSLNDVRKLLEVVYNQERATNLDNILYHIPT